MKKYVIPAMLAAAALCIAAFALYVLISGAGEDNTPPVLTLDSPSITLSVGDGEEALLAGVSARDDRDGDVTHLVVVEGVSAIRPDGSAAVTYAAFDGAGNVAKAERTVVYSDYEGPRFALSAPLVFAGGRSFDLFDCVTASDPLDGDLTGQIKASLVGGEGDITQEGLHQVELRVTNSMGDTQRLILPVEVYDRTVYTAEVILSQYLVYLERGSSFHPADYLEGLKVGVTKYPMDSETTMTVKNGVRTTAAGTYSVDYTLTRGDHTGFTRLIVIVEE